MGLRGPELDVALKRATALGAWYRLSFVFCLTLHWPASARANGRFPAANSIVFAPEQEGRFIVRTTFGLLEVRSPGEAPTWTCEQALGFASEEDPLLVITASGARVVASSSGAVVSHDGCSFEAVQGLEAQLIMDLTFDVDRGRVLALGVEIEGDGGTRSHIFESTDQGASFQVLGEPFPPELLPITLDAARSDGDRVYVTGRLRTETGYSGVLYTSSDGGEHFSEYAVPDTDATRLPFIAAISPTEPARVYLRVSDPAGSVLWATEDGGESLERITRGNGALLGFAASPDGAEIAFGGPEDGVSLGAADGSDFRRVHDLPVTCLSWSESGLFACGSMAADDDALVFVSIDSGRRFSEVFGRSQLDGETGCAEDSAVSSLCLPQWPAISDAIAPPVVSRPEPSGGAAGAAPAPEPAPLPEEQKDGCSVAVQPPRAGGAPWLAALAVTLLAHRRAARAAQRVGSRPPEPARAPRS